MEVNAKNYAVQNEPHQPFPISNFEAGLMLAREAWLSNEKAFRKMENCRAFRGQIVKRGGFSMLAELTDGTAEKVQTQNLPTLKVNVPGDGDYWQYTLQAPYLERPNIASVRYACNAGAGAPAANIYGRLANQRWTDTGYSGYLGLATPAGWEYDVVAEGTTTVIGYAWLDPFAVGPRFVSEVCWEIHPSFVAMPVDVTPGEIRYQVNPETDIVGLYEFKNGAGTYNIACDADYVYRFNLTTRYYERQGFAAAPSFTGPFTGSSSDYFWFENVDSYVVMTNNKDPVCKWDPSLVAADSVVEMPTDWNTPGTNELDTCKLVFQFAGRTVYFNTVENTTRYGTRARWTDAGTATGWRSPSDYTDAPTYMGDIVTGGFIGERLFIGFEKGWMEFVRRPNDDQQAFEWRPFISRFGAVSALSTIPDNERLLSRSDTSMQSLDPNGQNYLDIEIPDLIQSLSVRYQDRCASIRNEEDRSFWWSYVTRNGTTPDGILCAVYDEANALSWSQYDVRMNVFSTFDRDQVVTWNQLSGRTMDQYQGQTINSLGGGAFGTTRVIGGQAKGVVYVFDGSLYDVYNEGIDEIFLTLDSQKLNMFPGLRAHLGWFDVFAEVPSAVDVRFSFYADEQNTPYLVKNVTLVNDPASDKTYRRIKVNRTATLHRFKVETLTRGNIAFDAFQLWARKAGRVRNF